MTTVGLSVTSYAPYVSPAGSQHLGVSALYPPEVGCIEAVPPFEVTESVATLTTDALSYIARGMAEGLAFKVTKYVLGASGFNPARFTQATPVVPGTTIEAQRYEGIITEYEQASVDGTTYSYTCRAPADYRGVIGEVGLIATILDSPANPAEVGTEFLYAVGHVPGIAKHRRKAVTLRVLLRG